MMPGVVLFIAGASLVAGIVCGPHFSRAWLTLTLTGAVAALAAAMFVLGGLDWEWRSVFLIGGETLHFRLDGVSSFFLVLLSVVGGAGAVYAREYWSDRQHPDSAPRGRAWWCGLLLSMGCVLLSSNGLHFLIAWELFTVCAYFLIALDRKGKETRAAGWLFLGASHAGTVCLFAFFGILAARTGSWELGPLREHASLEPLFWLALVGFGVKAGLFPLHIWLPAAHANAPSHVSAIMSGVALKMGVYGLVRFSGWMPVPSATGWVVITLGAVSALFGIAFALAQNDLKRLLAYSSVENVGIIMVGLGGALLGAAHGQAAWGNLAMFGALLHVWNHGVFKSLLFFCAGSVLHATGTRDMSRLGGLWGTMPWTTSLFALGIFAVVGLPPLNGFISEWLIYLGLFEAAAEREATLWPVVPAIIMVAMTGAMALACFAKAGSIVFLGNARTKTARDAHECGLLMRGPMLALAGICLVIGVAPVLVWPFLSRTVGAWNPSWSTYETPVPLVALGWVHLVLIFGGSVAAISLIRKAHANGTSRTLTWDCGYAKPSTRMQYTSGSFGDLAAGWFGWLLRPELKWRRLHCPFPAKATHIQRHPETVLEYVLTPASHAIMRVSNVVRRLQHGRLQAYILYVAAGLLVLGFLVLTGGTP